MLIFLHRNFLLPREEIKGRINSLGVYLGRLRIPCEAEKLYFAAKKRFKKQVKNSEEESAAIEENIKTCKKVVENCQELKGHFNNTGIANYSVPIPCPMEEKNDWILSQTFCTKNDIDNARQDLKLVVQTLEKNIRIHNTLKKQCGETI